VNLIDLETVAPWDCATVLASVRRTGRLLIVEEARPSGGWGSHVIVAVCATTWGALKAPPVRTIGARCASWSDELE
jgi:pyruvate dehydrogenase E1 component beta subunit